MTENEEVMILENLRPGCGEKLSFSEGEICEAIDTAISALKEIQQYRKIGTVEECWEAVERLEAKPVKNRKILRNFHGNPYGIQGDCPNCGCERITSMSTDWCHVCGQHLKYDENLEGMEGGTGQV